MYRFNNYVKTKELLNLCRISKDLYNQALHKFIETFKSEEHKFLTYYDLNRIMQTEEKLEGKINYKLLKAQVAQQTLKVLDKSLKAYFKSIKDWKLHKEKYKDIRFMENEESYTSKCDALAFEDIGKHEIYFGKRIMRGLFQSSVDKVINADVNGALNIMRKVVGDSRLITEIIDSGRLFRPKKLKDLYHLIS